MNAIIRKPKRSFWSFIPLILTFLAGVYFFYEFIVSRIIPTKYLVAYGVVYALALLFVGFFSLKRFQRARGVAVAVSILAMVSFLTVGGFGIYLLSTGSSTINKLGSKGGVTIDNRKPFNIYISGIDTYGDIATQSRSDVNIVATVNPKTHSVLLTTLPRDSYVSIAGGGNDGMDKLTHAGNYGVESSMQTVARVLDTDIDAYVRINFTTFVESIDALGGITVTNPTAFEADGQSFPVGQVKLDGKRALIYSRERKSLEGGDVDRGKNQQRVVDGIIQKSSSIRTVGGYNALLSMLSSSVQTNISNDTIREFIYSQVELPVKWTSTAYSLEGKGQTGGLPSYAMPSSQLYMYVLDKGSVEKASADIKRVLDAE